MSERDGGPSWITIFALVGMLILVLMQRERITTLTNETRDLQRRVGQLESERR